MVLRILVLQKVTEYSPDYAPRCSDSNEPSYKAVAMTGLEKVKSNGTNTHLVYVIKKILFFIF